jgi:hypothetical protein
MADWVIYKDGAYWSDAHGWRSFDRATHFTPAEKTSIPIGKWVDIDEIQVWMGDKAKEDVPLSELEVIRQSDRAVASRFEGDSLIVARSLWLGREAMIKFGVHTEQCDLYYVEFRTALISYIPKWLFMMAKKTYLGLG